MPILWTLFRREFSGYFATPLAYVFLIVFLAFAGAFTFYLGQFFERGQADLSPFFSFHPWLYLFLIPAVAMRLWAEERKAGTIELLLTMPISLATVVLGKFLAAWAFCSVALALTFPIWVTVNILGNPDNGAIMGGYIGSLLMAGAYLAIGACMSALTKNQVIAFVLAAAVGFIFTLSGTPMVLNAFTGWLPPALVDTVSSFSFLTQFETIAKGIVDLRTIVFFSAVIGTFLCANTIVINIKKAH